MANKKILTVEEQKHLLSTLPELFQNLTQAEIQDIIVKLGLQDLLDQDGNLINVYTVDIYSNKPTYIISDYDIKIRGNAYNKSVLANDEVTSWRWERISGVSAEDIAWAKGKNTQELTLSESDFTSRVHTRDITFKVYATIKNTEYSDEITYSKSQIFNKIQIKASHDLFLESFPSSITVTTVEEGIFSDYKWYLGNTLVATTKSFNLSVNFIPLKSSAVLKVEAKDSTGKIHSDTKTIPRISNGSNGEPGVPGTPGSNSYTWIKYSDSPDGTNMSEYPVDSITGLSRSYIGIASNKSTPIESNNPSDYTWSKYIGTDGVPGENGYMWIKYSEYPLGRDTNGTISMFDTPFIMENGVREDMVYMGIAYNKQTKTEADPSTPEGAPEVYTWSKIKGENGHSNYILELSNDNTSVPALADGTIPNPAVAFSTATTNISLTYGNDLVDRGEYTLQFNASSGVTFVTSNQGHTLSITGLTADVGQIEVKAVSTGTTPKIIATDTFNIVKIKGSAIYEIFPSVNAIKVTNTPGQNPTLSPAAIEVNVKMNTGESVSNVTSGKLTYKYIYANTNYNSTDDGTQITIGELMQINNSGDPLFIEFKYFHPVSGVMVDKERIPFIRDGINSTSTEMRYAKNGSFTVAPDINNTESNPAGWSLNPPSVTSSEVLWMTKASKYESGTLVGTWSIPVRISGPAGPAGPPGPAGSSASNIFIAPMGNWDSTKQYIGNTKRVEAVKYGDSWYVTRQDVSNGIVPAGTTPTNTTYWNKADVNYDFVATGLLLAQAAYIENLMIRNLKTADSGKRVEITQDTNTIEFYTDMDESNPTIKIDATTGYNTSYGTNGTPSTGLQNDASMIMRNASGVTSVGTTGIFSNETKTSFIPPSTGVNNAASLVGLNFGREQIPTYGMMAVYAGVAGQLALGSDNIDKVNTGAFFGGYFNTIMIGGRFESSVNITDSYSATAYNSNIVNYATKDVTITLPPLKNNSSGNWSSGSAFKITIIKVNTGNTMILSGGNNKIIYGTTTATNINITGRTKVELIWDGSYWLAF